MEFPRLVYRSASEHTLVDSQEAFEGALKKGWFASVPECAPKAAASDETAPPTRAEMEAQAQILGIKFDGRWSDASLLKAISKAMKGG